MRDLTERKIAENASRLHDLRLRAMLDLNKMAMAPKEEILDFLRESIAEITQSRFSTIDRNGVFTFLNSVGASRLGGRPRDYIGKTMWDMFPQEFADRQMAAVAKAIDTQQGVRVVTMVHLKGQLRWYESTIEPLRNREGKVVSALLISRDVHEAKQAQEQLNTYREEMARTERLASLGTLSATIAHELSQPLTTVGLSVGNSLAALKATSGSQALVEELEEASAGLSHINTIVSKFRGFSVVSSDKTVEQVDLKVVAQRILNLLAQSAL